MKEKENNSTIEQFQVLSTNYLKDNDVTNTRETLVTYFHYRLNIKIATQLAILHIRCDNSIRLIKQ